MNSKAQNKVRGALALSLAATLFAGCAGSQRTYTGDAKTVQVRERIAEQWTRGGDSFTQRLSKIVLVDNPYDKPVTVIIDCGWGEAAEEVEIGAHKSHTRMVTPQRWKAYRQSCYIADWSFVPEQVAHK